MGIPTIPHILNQLCIDPVKDVVTEAPFQLPVNNRLVKAMITPLDAKLPPELQVMPFNLRLMELIGLWGDRKSFVRFVVIFGWGISIIHIPKAVLGMGSTEFDVMAKGIAEFFFQVSLYASVAIFAAKRVHFERIVSLLTSIFTEVTGNDSSMDFNKAISVQNSKMEKFSKFYLCYCSVGPIVYILPPMTISYVRYFTANSTEPLRFELAMEQEFYGMQIRTNFLHYHIFMALSMMAYYVSSILSVIKVPALLIMIKYSSLSFKLVALRVQKLADTKVTLPQLIDIVNMHKKAFEITNLVESIVHIPMAMQFFTCVMYWGLTMIYAATNLNLNIFNLMVPFLLSLVETYGFSYLGTELTWEAEGIGKAIYDLPWYEDSVEMQRYYRLILQRTQRKAQVTAFKLFPVGLEKFGRVVNQTYSYYLVLKDAFARM